ncbi:cytochrome p450 family protein [Pelomyxa schiedti]|nr:cytochrome p450 family protein [Pelomyxa schiedti]
MAEDQPLVVQIQSNRVYDDRVFCCCCRRSPHVRCLIFTFLVVGSLIYLPIALTVLSSVAWCDIAAYCAVGVTYLTYFIDCAFGITSRHLWFMRDVESVFDYVIRIKSVPPRLSIHCECYHYETRTKYITERDSQGNTHTRTETETVKVTTYTETENFSYDRWDDQSGDLTTEIASRRYIKVDYEKTWHCGDSHTEHAWQRFQDVFNARNQNRDTHYSWFTSYSIDGLHDHMLSVTDLSKKSPMLAWRWYFLFSLVLLSYPYRMWVEGLADYAKFTFSKRVFVN